jgi:hypothetical protein
LYIDQVPDGALGQFCYPEVRGAQQPWKHYLDYCLNNFLEMSTFTFTIQSAMRLHIRSVVFSLACNIANIYRCFFANAEELIIEKPFGDDAKESAARCSTGQLF